MLTTKEIIDLAIEARSRHKERIVDSERRYQSDIHNIREDCPHEFSDIWNVVDFNDCSTHVKYCRACGKETD